uniref:Uncharacterized protein n=1 Tax=Aegilops tauschii subsp. strangulata TaxID=200361 RepID=A0A453J173_AEGTS
EFGTDGGPAAKNLEPKFNSFTKNISVHLGVVVPHVELKHVIAATIGLKGLGGLLFILSSSFGAYLLGPLPCFHHTGCLRLLQLRHGEG